MTARFAGALAALAWAIAAPTPAAAYSDASQFAAPVLEAGGGGRFYTGSPAEGYACETCHVGGANPRVQVSGVPERYVPGATYQLQVTWPASLAHLGAVFEVTDDRGRGAGELALPPEAERSDSELCEPRDLGVLAAQLYPADIARTIVAVPDCGAGAVRVQWTAPTPRVGPIWLAGAVVASNHDGDVTGDGVTVFAQPVPAFGESLPAPESGASCALAGSPSHGAASSHVLVLVGLMCMVLLGRLRRRVPRCRLVRTFLVLGAVSSCAIEEPATEPAGRVELERGRAVRPWPMPEADAAQESGAAMGDEQARVAFRVTTKPQGGRYQPKNIGAIWVEDASGAWVETLAVWANLRERYLVEYYASNPTRNKLDAVTSATLRAHETHAIAWDLRDAEDREVGDGEYRIFVEVTDRDAAGQLTSIAFTKSGTPGAPMTVTLPETPYFGDVELRYE